MHPDLFRFHGFTLHTYGVLVAAGFLAGVALSVREARRLGVDPDRILNLCFYLALAAILGARLLYIVLYLKAYLNSPLDILKIWEGGLVFSGGLIGALIVGILYIRHQGWHTGEIADITAPGIALGQAIGRLGCFSAGCCYGKPTDVPWAVVFKNPHSLAPIGIPLHPTQLYSSAGNLAIFGILWGYRKRKKRSGQVMCLYLGLHSISRLIQEHFRGDFRGKLTGSLTITQGVSILLLTASVGVWIYLNRSPSSK